MAIDITKLPGDMLIGVDNLNKKFKQFAQDFKDQNEAIRVQEARDRAMNTEAVKEALANQAERQAYYTTQFMKEGMSEQEQLAAKDQARKEAQLDTMNALREQQQLAYDNETGPVSATFTMMVDKLDALLGVSEKANKLAQFRNDIAKKGLVQTIKDNREAAAAAEKEEALQESGSTGIGTKVADVAGKAFEPLRNIFGGLKAVFLGAAGIFVPLLAFFKALENPKFREIVFALLDFGKRVFKESLQTVIDVFSSLIDTITSIVDKFKIIFSGDTTLAEKFSAFFGIFGDIGKFIFDAIDTITENLLNVFGVSFAPYDGLASWVVGKIGEAFTAIKNFFVGAYNFVLDGFTNIVDFIVDKVTAAFTGIKNFFMGVAEFTVDGFTSLKDFVVDKATSGFRVVKDWFNGATEFFVDGYGNIKDFIVDKATMAFQGVKDWFGGVGDFFVDGFTSFRDFLFGEDGIVSNAINWVKNLFSFELPDFRDFLPKWLGGKGKDLEDVQMAQAGTAGDMAGEAAMENAATDTQTQLDKLLQLDEKAAKEQYEALMKKMEANEELTADEQQFIQQINVVKGGDSVNTNSSTGFSTRKLPFVDDVTTQALTTSYP